MKGGGLAYTSNKMKKKVTKLNDEAKERLKVIEYLQKPNTTFIEAGELFGIHETTASEWWKIYHKEGIEGLKRPRKPRPKHNINIDEVRKLLKGKLSDQDNRRCLMLIDMLELGLRKSSQKWEMTEQGLAKIRRQYMAGDWPVTLTL